MQDQSLTLLHWETEELLEKIKSEFPEYTYHHKKHLINLTEQEGSGRALIRLPLHLAIDEELSLLNDEANAVYLSVESGNAAICLMEGEDLVYHTTFSAYMTRKKQGFSQIKYLNKKGKSRAGSRVRLAETVEFFERINNTMNELFEDFEISRLALNCNKTLLPYLLQSRVPFPVDKKDPMLYKIPLYIPQSNFTNLEATIQKLRSPVLLYDDNHANEMLEIFDETWH